MTPPRPERPGKRKMLGMPWNCHWAKVCFDGKMVICDGRLWMDVTDKVLKEFERQRERKGSDGDKR